MDFMDVWKLQNEGLGAPAVALPTGNRPLARKHSGGLLANALAIHVLRFPLFEGVARRSSTLGLRRSSTIPT